MSKHYVLLYRAPSPGNDCFQRVIKDFVIINREVLSKCNLASIIKLIIGKKLNVIGLLDMSDKIVILSQHSNGFIVRGLNKFMLKHFTGTGCLIVIDYIELNYSRTVNSVSFASGELGGIVFYKGKFYYAHYPIVLVLSASKKLFKLTIINSNDRKGNTNEFFRLSFNNYVINELSNYGSTVLINNVKKVTDYTLKNNTDELIVGNPLEINTSALRGLLNKNKVFYYWLFNNLCDDYRHEQCSYINYDDKVISISNNTNPLSFDEFGSDVVMLNTVEPTKLPVYFQNELVFKTNVNDKIKFSDDLKPEELFSFKRISNSLKKSIKIRTFQQLGFMHEKVFFPVVAHAKVMFRFYGKDYWFFNYLLFRALSYKIIMNEYDNLSITGDYPDSEKLIRINPGRFVLYKFDSWNIGLSWNNHDKRLWGIGDDVSLDLL